MSLSFFLTNFVASLLLPPLNGLLPLALGWWLWHRRPDVARLLVAIGVLLIVIQSLPVVGILLTRRLEARPLELKRANAQAIVVLGGGRHRDAPEYGGDTVSDGGLVRLRYAVKLYRSTGLPLLVTGGKPDGGELSEAETMRRVLVNEFHVPVKWCEGESENSRESAVRTAKLFKKIGVSRVLLVTHAVHMRRAAEAFTAAGLEVTPAPTDFTGGPLTPLDFVPQSGGLATTGAALHEWIGILWYRLKAGKGSWAFGKLRIDGT